MTGYDVLLWGIYFCDLIFTGLPNVPRLGAEVFSRDFSMTPGGPFNTALALHRLGVRVGWACDFGNDFFSQFVLEKARHEGLDTSLFQVHDYPIRRLSAAFSFSHDRGFLSFSENVPQSPIIPLVEQHRPRCLLLPHLHYGEAYSEMFAATRRAGTIIYMDCQSNDATLSTPGVVEALRSVDIFAPNEAEALQLTGSDSVECALEVLSALTPLVIIKRGADGASACSAGQVTHAPGLKVDVVDTTGAGDCFNAGFLYGYLVRQAPLKVCLRAANICGGLAATAAGGEAIPTIEQVEAHL